MAHQDTRLFMSVIGVAVVLRLAKPSIMASNGTLDQVNHRRRNMDNYTKFCRSKKCGHFIEWELDTGYGPYPCNSCTKVGQSYEVEEYPEDCPFFDEISILSDKSPLKDGESLTGPNTEPQNPSTAGMNKPNN